jgi:O-antigen/teichoic acid export membrane protein
MADPVATQENVGSIARRALGWSFLNNFVGRAGTLLVGIVLARLLVPEDYGIYAVALVALNAVLSVNELGVSLAVVRWPGDVDRIAPTVVSLSLGSSAVLWLGCFVLSPVVCRALQAPEATGVLRVLTLSVLIDAVTAVPAALMTRAFRQRERMIVDTAGLLVSSAAAVGFALAGLGAWALAISLILGNLANSLFVLWYTPRWHAPGFQKDVARELLAFGLPLAAASLVIFGLLNVDYVIVGGLLGPTALGFYLLAFNLSAWPVNIISAPIRRVSMPAFARLHESADGASAAYLRACLLVLLVTAPISLLIAVFARPMIEFVYGDRWLESAAVLPWLMVLATVRVLSELTYDFFVALGRSRVNLVIQIAWLVGLVPALVIGARQGGIVGVGIGHAAIGLLLVLPAYAVALRSSQVSVLQLAAPLLRPSIGLLVAAAIGIGSLRLVDSDPLVLVVGGGLSALGYLVAVRPYFRLLSSLNQPV